MRLFVDTWGWMTLGDRREARHQEVEKWFRHFREQGGIAYTSDYILDETLTLLFRRLPFKVARNSLETIEWAIKEGYLKLERINASRFERAKELRLRFQDKPRISFTDLTSMVVMEELRLKKILTEDEHFIQVGMEFQKVP